MTLLADDILIERLKQLTSELRETWREVERRSFQMPLGATLMNEALVALRGYELRESNRVEEKEIKRPQTKARNRVDPLERALKAIKDAGIEL